MPPFHKGGLGGCPTTLLMPAFVILSEAKNLMDSGTYTLQILRLTPQNDVVGQPLRGDFVHGHGVGLTTRRAILNRSYGDATLSSWLMD